ncbi:MAG: hypothetical protein ACQEQV_03490, partial [Fibrobacterota bacterium]
LQELIMNSESAQKNIQIVRDALQKARGGDSFHSMLMALGGFSIFSGAFIMALCAGIALLMQPGHALETGIPPAGIVAIIGVALVFFGTLKMFIVRRYVRRRGMTLREVLKKSMLNSDFLLFDIPLELTAVVLIVFLIHIGQPVYIIPLGMFVAGHGLNGVGLIYNVRAYCVMAYLLILSAAAGLFFLMDSPLLFIGAGFGLPFLIGGIHIELLRHREEKEREEPSHGA